jgi:hypothetical protein
MGWSHTQGVSSNIKGHTSRFNPESANPEFNLWWRRYLFPLECSLLSECASYGFKLTV